MRLLIAGGGTGGHLFPGVAIAEELRAREPDAVIRFVVALWFVEFWNQLCSVGVMSSAITQNRPVVITSKPASEGRLTGD